MYYAMLESAQQASPDLFYSAILSVCARIIACDTEWIAVDRNHDDVELYDCAILIVANYPLRIVSWHFLSTLESILLSATTRGYTLHVLMGFLGLFLLPTMSSNTGSSSESDE